MGKYYNGNRTDSQKNVADRHLHLPVLCLQKLMEVNLVKQNREISGLTLRKHLLTIFINFG